MSMTVGTGTSPRKGGGRRRPSPDINVTPLVDVMMVLLVIFMITVQATKQSFTVELPEAEGMVQEDSGKTPNDVSIDELGKIHVGQHILDLASAEQELPRIVKGHEKEEWTLNAHRKLPYETVVKIISAIRAGGVETIYVAVESQQK